MASASSTFTPLRIIVDTREQHPYQFDKYDAEVIRHGLKTGDYSLAGLEDRIALERKSLDDLIGCLIKGRDRFKRELERAGNLDYFAVIVEASMDDVRMHRYRNQIKPHAALQSILAFQVRYGVNFIWAGNRAGGEYSTFWTLEKYRREHEAREAKAPPGQDVRASGEMSSTLH